MSEASRINCVRVIDFEKRLNPEKHYVFVLRVKREDGVKFLIYRRYNAFYTLHKKLTSLFPVASGACGQSDGTQQLLPTLPGKIYLRKSHTPSVARERIYPLQQYCQALVSLPSYISECTAVLEFFTPTDADVQAALDQPKPENDGGDKRASEACSDISGPLDLDEYTVLADFHSEIASPAGPRAPKQRTIPTGDVVKVIQKKDTGWWYVISSGGIECWMPRSYLEPRFEVEEDLVSSGSKGGPYICTESYTKQNDDEISLTRGMLVNVLEKNYDGWWLVEHKSTKGLAPGCFLVKSKSIKARQLMSSHYVLDAKKVPSAHSAPDSKPNGKTAAEVAAEDIPFNFQPGPDAETSQKGGETRIGAGIARVQPRIRMGSSEQTANPKEPTQLPQGANVGSDLAKNEITSGESLLRVRDRSSKAAGDKHRSVRVLPAVCEASAGVEADRLDSSRDYSPLPEVGRERAINKSLLPPPPRMGSIKKTPMNKFTAKTAVASR